MMRQCAGRKENGQLCRTMPLKDGESRLMHSPEHAVEAAEARRLGGLGAAARWRSLRLPTSPAGERGRRTDLVWQGSTRTAGHIDTLGVCRNSFYEVIPKNGAIGR